MNASASWRQMQQRLAALELEERQQMMQLQVSSSRRDDAAGSGGSDGAAAQLQLLPAVQSYRAGLLALPMLAEEGPEEQQQQQQQQQPQQHRQQGDEEGWVGRATAEALIAAFADAEVRGVGWTEGGGSNSADTD